MKTTLLKISTLCAACSMLAAAAQAQPDSQKGLINENMPSVQPGSPNPLPPDQGTRSWSTKKLSATGRTTEQAVRASKLTGAPLKDSSGNSAGQIQDLIVNPATGRVEFALVSLSTTNTNATGKVVPVPWALLKCSSESAHYANATPESCSFTLNADAGKLSKAPTVDWSNPSQSEWRQRIYAYYGVTPPPMGGAESPSGETKGGGLHQIQPIPPPRPNP